MKNVILSKKNYETFSGILKMSQGGLRHSLRTFLSEVYGKDKIIATNDYVVAMGDIPIGLVAHLDTVHLTPVKDILYDREQNLMWSPQGLGADDRAGVYSILQIVSRGYRPTVIFTTDEEKGGIGALKLSNDLDKITSEVNFLVELDRRGENDCVFYECDNEAFEKYVESYGFVTDFGSFSDIHFLCPAWGIAGVNLSIGYYNEHTKYEYLNVNEMQQTIEKVVDMLDGVDAEKDKFEYIPSKGNKLYGDIFSGANSTGTYYDYCAGRDEELCWGCLGSFSKDAVVPVGDGQYCIDCYEKEFSSCIDCGTPFRDRFKVHLLCEKCRKR